MNIGKLREMSVDELWMFRDEVAAALVKQMSAKKTVLEDRLSKLIIRKARTKTAFSPRRRYPKVLPKFENPKDPSDTWAHGKQTTTLAKRSTEVG
jgi:DNA-binding protein H-NS